MPKVETSDDTLALEMYDQRRKHDAAQGNGHIYTDNPDARALYFKGVHDAITCLESASKVSKQAAAQMLTLLLEQTDVEANRL